MIARDERAVQVGPGTAEGWYGTSGAVKEGRWPEWLSVLTFEFAEVLT